MYPVETPNTEYKMNSVSDKVILREWSVEIIL